MAECDEPELMLNGTGSEIVLRVEAAKEMSGKKVSVVSMPSREILRQGHLRGGGV